MIVEQSTMADIVLDAAKEVFQTMIFMDIEPATDDKPIGGDTLLGSITFKGELEGCLGVCCDVSSARAVAGNMLGMDNGDSLSEGELVDAIGEVANMVMGSIKTRLQSTTPNIELSIPSVVSGRILKTNLGDGATRILTKVTLGGAHRAELSFLSRARG